MAQQKKQKRFYYIQYSPYGVRISLDSLNGNAFSYYAFASYTARQKWLDENDMMALIGLLILLRARNYKNESVSGLQLLRIMEFTATTIQL